MWLFSLRPGPPLRRRNHGLHLDGRARRAEDGRRRPPHPRVIVGRYGCQSKPLTRGSSARKLAAHPLRVTVALRCPGLPL
jgi:hypothetical protein